MRNLDKDLELCGKATEPPWEVTTLARDEVYITRGHRYENGKHIADWIAVLDSGDDDKSEETIHADAAFIAASREGWPEAMRRVLAAEAENERLEELADVLGHEVMSANADLAKSNMKLRARVAVKSKLETENERLYRAFGRIYEERMTIDEIEKAIDEIDECALIEATLKKMVIVRDMALKALSGSGRYKALEKVAEAVKKVLDTFDDDIFPAVYTNALAELHKAYDTLDEMEVSKDG